AVLGESGEGMDGVIAPHKPAEIGLHAPDGENDFRLHTRSLLRSGERLRPFPAHRLPLAGLRGGDALVEILLHRLGKFWLLARQLHHFGTGRIGRERGFKSLAAYTHGLRLGPEPTNEIGRARLRCTRYSHAQHPKHRRRGEEASNLWEDGVCLAHQGLNTRVQENRWRAAVGTQIAVGTHAPGRAP